MISLHQLLKTMIERGASDLHISTGSPPQVRIDGKLIPLDLPPLTPAEAKRLCYSVLTEAQKHRYEEDNELDLSFGVKDLSRFRANIFMQRGSVAGAFRSIPFKVFTFDELGLPPAMQELSNKPRGLILVTGPTGSGKSTTLAAIIDKINTERHEHIVTIEDPIEYLHPHKNCVVNQREVNADTESFKKALRYILRQDPDVVMIGEMRDLETIEAALTVAETMNRIIDVFPAHQQPQVRAQLSFVLEGILSQQLLPKMSGRGRGLAVELLVPNPAIRNLIREDKVHQIYSQMQMGQDRFGMQTMNQSLHQLWHKKIVSLDDVMLRTSDPDELRQMIAKGAPDAIHGRRMRTVQ
jgi:twitching motility protein PilT